MSGVPRKELTDLLQPLLPKGWRVINSEREADEKGTTLRLQQRKIRRHPQAGTSVRLVDFQATLTTEGTDLERAEDRLDDELTALVWVLDEQNILWDEWTKAIFEGALGYQSTLSITAFKEL